MKKNILVPIVILGLMAAFSIVCVFVFVTRGRDSWIRRKLRLGGIILSLTAGTISCSDDDCYVAVRPTMYPCASTNSQLVMYTNGAVVDLSVSNILYLKFNIPVSSNDSFTYRIADAVDATMASNSLEVVTFPDPGLESRFAVSIDGSMPDGDYTLMFYMHYTNGYSWPMYGSDISLTVTR